MDRGMRSRDRTILALQEHIYHAHSLANAKAVTDTSTPKCFTPHAKRRKGKAAYIEHTNRLQISVENARLCKNIKKQMDRKPTLIHKFTPKSLNKSIRIGEINRISVENNRIFKLLSDTQPCISRFTLAKFYRKADKYRKIHCRRNSHEFVWTRFSNRIAYSKEKI